MSNPKTSAGWGVAGLGWAAADFVVPSMVLSPGSKLAACLGSSPEKAQEFAQRFGVEYAYSDLDALLHDPGVNAVYIALPDGEDSLQTVAVTHAVLKSVEERRIVAVPAVE